MPEQFKPKEYGLKEPFEIRGHHLPTFIEFMKCEATPEQYAKYLRALNEHQRSTHEYMLSYTSNANKLLFGNHKAIKYANEIIGTTSEDAKQFEKNSVNIFKKFMDLPNESPIKLVAGKLDLLCRACTGNNEHCAQNSHKSVGGGRNVLKGDERTIHDFLLAAQKISADKKILIKTEVVNFTDSRPKITSSYTMQTEDFKKTIRYIIQNPKGFPKLINS